MKANKTTCEVAVHFNKPPHTFFEFTFQCVDQILTSSNHDTDKLLITKEAMILERAIIFSCAFWIK